MFKPYVNAVRITTGTYRIIDRHLDREATILSTSAASALTRYLGIQAPGHPSIDMPVEAMGVSHAMTIEP
jgi:hypothetical protein